MSDLSSPPVKLSICISTFNRGREIIETLDSIVPQLNDDVELLVLDGASPDDTEAVLTAYQKKNSVVRYIRAQKNSGVDADFDNAINLAQGRWCWLMTDDDLLLPGAVTSVLQALTDDPDLVIVDAEVRNQDFSETLQNSRLFLEKDRYFASADDDFMATVGDALSFIGCVIVKRQRWMERDKAPYYGTLFIHVGVIFQNPPLHNIKVLSRPHILIRYGNAMWTSRSFEIWMFKWPQLIWSFPAYSEEAKRAVCLDAPWQRTSVLLKHRATGSYSLDEYRQFIHANANFYRRTLARLIATLPSRAVNFLVVAYIVLLRRTARLTLDDLLQSPAASRPSRQLAKLM